MSTSTGLAKCSCIHCGGHLEFETAYAGVRVSCPHCGNETCLHIPTTAMSATAPASSAGPETPIAQSGCRLAESPRPGPAAANIPSFRSPKITQSRRRALPGIVVRSTLVALGLIVGAIYTYHRLEAKREEQRLEQLKPKVAAAFESIFQQLDGKETITNTLSTGNARLDGLFRFVVDLCNDLKTSVDKVNSEFTALEQRRMLSALGSVAEIRAEINKRAAAQKLCETCERDVGAMLDRAQQRLIALKLPKKLQETGLRHFERGGQVRSKFAQSFSLTRRWLQAESDLLEWMLTQFGRYRLVNGRIRFTSAGQLEEFNRYSQILRGIAAEAEAFDSERKARLRAVPEQIKALTD